MGLNVEETIIKWQFQFTDIMRKRQTIYSKFMAPWNVSKADDLSRLDGEIEKIFIAVRNLLNDINFEKNLSFKREMEEASNWKKRFDASQSLYANAQKDYAELHNAYDQLVLKVEQMELYGKADIKSGSKKTQRTKKSKNI